MHGKYLEVTFRSGKPLAAYFYLPRQPGDKSVRVEKIDFGLLIDFAADGRPIGIEFAVPELLNVEAVNKVLQAHGLAPIEEAELAPLKVAA